MEKTQQELTLKETEKEYKKVAKNYDKSLFILFGNDSKYRRELISKLNLKKGDKVLVLACGTGKDFEFIEEKIGNSGKIIAVDYSEEMLNEARKKIDKNGWKNIELVRGDASKIKYDKEFDAAICNYAFSIIPNYEETLKKLIKSVKINGIVGVLDVKKIEGFFSFLNPVFHSATKSLISEYDESRKIYGLMKKQLNEFNMKEIFMGYIYIAWGKRK